MEMITRINFNRRKYMECTVINNETGEILYEDYKIETLKDKKRKQKGAEKAQDFEQFKQLQGEKMGNFIFFLYNQLNNLNNLLNDNDLCRYIYLATYIKKDGYLMLDNNKYVTRKTMQELIKVSEKTFKTFYSNITKNNLIIKENNKYKINLDIFWRGYEKDYKDLTGNRLEDYTRIYINATRELYNSNYKQLKKLAIAYKLIPYINWKYNILCTNIQEVETLKINILSISNIMDILGYNKRHIARFKKDFYEIKFYGYDLFVTVQKQADYKTSRILVNPLFAYRNKTIEDIQYLFMLFGIK